MAVIAVAQSEVAPGQQGVRLSRRVVRGDVLLREAPLAAVSETHCGGCMRPAERRCSSCKTLVYCSRHCQKTDWTTFHKKECPSIVKLPHPPVPTLRLLARILRREDIRRVLAASVAMDDSQTPEQLEQHVSILAVLRHFVTDDEVELLREAHSLLCKLRCNVFSICDAENNPIGTGFFPQLRRFNHACTANCGIVFEGAIARLSAAANLPAGTELLISYVPPTDSLDSRSLALKQQFGFVCRCQRCLDERARGDPLYSFKCTESNCQGWMPLGLEQPGSFSCGHAFDSEVERRARSLVADAQPALASSDVRKIKELFPRMEKTLPMFASVMHQAANVLCDAAINEQQFDKAAAFAENSVAIYRLPGVVGDNPVRALNFFRLGKLADLLEQHSAALAAMREAVELLTTFYGPSHTLTLEAMGMADSMQRQKDATAR